MRPGGAREKGYSPAHLQPLPGQLPEDLLTPGGAALARGYCPVHLRGLREATRSAGGTSLRPAGSREGRESVRYLCVRSLT